MNIASEISPETITQSAVSYRAAMRLGQVVMSLIAIEGTNVKRGLEKPAPADANEVKSP